MVRSGALLTLAVAAMLLAGTTGTAGGKTKLFSSGPINMPIPDRTGPISFEVSSNLYVKKRGTIKDVDLAIRITHPDTTDLDLNIFKGLAGGVLLVDHYPKDGVAASPDFGSGAAGCSGAVFTTFDDSAPLSITAGLNPFAGSFRPEQALRDFKGGRMQGKWSLGLHDGTPTDAGTLNCWQLLIRYKPLRKKR